MMGRRPYKHPDVRGSPRTTNSLPKVRPFLRVTLGSAPRDNALAGERVDWRSAKEILSRARGLKILCPRQGSAMKLKRLTQIGSSLRPLFLIIRLLGTNSSMHRVHIKATAGAEASRLSLVST